MNIDKKLISELSTRGEFSGAATFGDRVKDRFAQKKKEEEQNSSNSQQEKVEQEIQWETLKEDVLSNKKEVVIDRVVLATLIKKIDSLEKTVKNLKLSDSLHHGLFR
ncbi:hypothetical protein HDR59_03115 [bacterium]|nr:hypothetical protein [bacterium]